MSFTAEQVAELKELIRDEIQSNLSISFNAECNGYGTSQWVSLSVSYDGATVGYDSFSCPA